MASLKHARPISALAHAALDVAFPPHCPSCDVAVEAEGNFCPACYDRLRLIASPFCVRCGIPFVFDVGADAQCADCLETPPDFAMARSVMVYDAISAPLVSALKFHDQWRGLERYVSMMRASGSGLLEGVEAIVPVPLHWRRRLLRRYNQAALLAYGLGRETGLRCYPHALRRAVYTKPQMRMDRKERLSNVKRAFVPGKQAAALKDKIVLLVDDVVTTGATVNACAVQLLKAGAKEVRVVSLARTVKE